MGRLANHVLGLVSAPRALHLYSPQVLLQYLLRRRLWLLAPLPLLNPQLQPWSFPRVL